MKTTLVRSLRTALTVFLAGALVVILYTSDRGGIKAPQVRAATTDNITGWAWSENIGWISFNNTTDGSATSYGVNLDTATGNLTGYAWSSNIGWINFAPAGPYPGLPNNSAQRSASGMLTGWIRALSADNLGWDGWIKLSDTTAPAYGVAIDPVTGNFSGFAWGSSVVGWIDFAPTVGGVPVQGVKYTPPPCTLSNGVCTGSYVCNPTSGTCILPGGACATNAQCGGGQQCNGNLVCVNLSGPCSTNAQCAGGQVCSAGGVCVTPSSGCTTNADCGGGQICNTLTKVCSKVKTQFQQF